VNDGQVGRLAASTHPAQFIWMIQDFEVLQQVATSARGTLCQARDRRSGRLVALKQWSMDGTGLASLQREVQALDAVQGNHVVELLESGYDSEGVYLALEWLAGGTLEACVACEPISTEGFVLFAAQALDALRSVHHAGWLHRDVTPANFMQSTGSLWKLVDFGEARPLDDGSLQPLVGSIHTMAPEQFEGGVLDERTDLYSLGCTFYKALTGRFAHEGDTTAQIITSHLHPGLSGLAQARPDLPDHVIVAVEKLIARGPQDRPQSCEEATRLLAWSA